MSVTNNAFMKKLHTMPLGTFVENQNVKVVKETDSLELAVKMMSDAKLHSLPVVDANGAPPRPPSTPLRCPRPFPLAQFSTLPF